MRLAVWATCVDVTRAVTVWMTCAGDVRGVNGWRLGRATRSPGWLAVRASERSDRWVSGGADGQ